MILVAYVLALAILFDGISTYQALQRGAHEVNPLRRWVISWAGLKWGIIGRAVILGIVVVLAYSPLASWARQHFINGEGVLALCYVFAASVFTYAGFINLEKGRR